MRTILSVLAGVLLMGAVVWAAEPAAPAKAAPKMFEVDKDGFIRNWVVLDPVQLVDQEMFHVHQFDRDFVRKLQKNPRNGDKLVQTNDLNWAAEKSDNWQLDLAAVGEARKLGTDNTLFQGVAYVWADAEIKDASLAIGSDDSSVWWLNGKEVIREYAGRPVNQDDNVATKLTLNKGMNLLRFALINGNGGLGAGARFKDAAGKPIKALKVTVEAAEAAPKFNVDDDGFVRDWLVLDPAPLDDRAGDHVEDSQKGFFDRDYVKAMGKNPKDGDKLSVPVKDLIWKAEKTDDWQLDLAVVGAARNIDSLDNTLFQGVAYVWSDVQVDDVSLGIGSDDSSVWWLNGKEVVRVYAGRAVNQDDNVAAKLTLNKGMNVLRFALINGDGDLGVCARFKDAAENPLTKVKVSVEAD